MVDYNKNNKTIKQSYIKRQERKKEKRQTFKNSELTCQGDTPTKEKDQEVMEIILA